MSPAAGRAGGDGRARILGAALAASGLADAGGGLWAVFDWQAVSALMAGAIPDWHAVGAAARRGLEGPALRQLWVNLGTALVGLGAAQGLAAWWVGRGRDAGFTLARVIGWALVAAAFLMAGPGGQRSSLLTEGARGVLLLGLVWWADRRPGGSDPPAG